VGFSHCFTLKKKGIKIKKQTKEFNRKEVKNGKCVFYTEKSILPYIKLFVMQRYTRVKNMAFVLGREVESKAMHLHIY
jgi:hypothetical protein